MSSTSGVEPAIERRVALRASAAGEIVLRAYDRTLLEGEMMDVSSGGFRIRYLGKRMRVGAEVQVVHPWSNLRAILAWTIRSGDWIHAGFALAPPPSLEEESVAEA